jgi:hypothetical protein
MNTLPPDTPSLAMKVVFLSEQEMSFISRYFPPNSQIVCSVSSNTYSALLMMVSAILSCICGHAHEVNRFVYSYEECVPEGGSRTVPPHLFGPVRQSPAGMPVKLVRQAVDKIKHPSTLRAGRFGPDFHLATDLRFPSCRFWPQKGSKVTKTVLKLTMLSAPMLVLRSFDHTE